jgi:hypothetical protein
MDYWYDHADNNPPHTTMTQIKLTHVLRLIMARPPARSGTILARLAEVKRGQHTLANALDNGPEIRQVLGGEMQLHLGQKQSCKGTADGRHPHDSMNVDIAIDLERPNAVKNHTRRVVGIDGAPIFIARHFLVPGSGCVERLLDLRVSAIHAEVRTRQTGYLNSAGVC